MQCSAVQRSAGPFSKQPMICGRHSRSGQPTISRVGWNWISYRFINLWASWSKSKWVKSSSAGAMYFPSFFALTSRELTENRVVTKGLWRSLAKSDCRSALHALFRPPGKGTDCFLTHTHKFLHILQTCLSSVNHTYLLRIGFVGKSDNYP